MTKPVIIPPYLAKLQDQDKVILNEIIELFNHLRQDDPFICVFYIDDIKNILRKCELYEYLLENPEIALHRVKYDFNPYIEAIFEYKELMGDDILYDLIINMDKESIISYCKQTKGRRYDETYSMGYLYRAKDNIDIEIINELGRISILCRDAIKFKLESYYTYNNTSEIGTIFPFYDSKKELYKNDVDVKLIDIINGKLPLIELRGLPPYNININKLCSLVKALIIKEKCTDLITIRLLNNSLFHIAYNIIEKGVDENIRNTITELKNEYENMIIETLNISSLKETEYSFDKVFPILINIENMEKLEETIITPYDEDDIKGVCSEIYIKHKDIDNIKDELEFEDNLLLCFNSIDSCKNIRYITRNPLLEPVHIRFLFNRLINRKEEVNYSEKDAFRDLISSLKHPKFNSVFESFSKDIIRMHKYNMWIIKAMSEVIKITEEDICWAIKNRSIGFINLLDKIKKEQKQNKLKSQKEDISSFVFFRTGYFEEEFNTPKTTLFREKETSIQPISSKEETRSLKPVMFDMEWEGRIIKANVTNGNIDVKEEEGQTIIKINLLKTKE